MLWPADQTVSRYAETVSAQGWALCLSNLPCFKKFRSLYGRAFFLRLFGLYWSPISAWAFNHIYVCRRIETRHGFAGPESLEITHLASQNVPNGLAVAYTSTTLFPPCPIELCTSLHTIHNRTPEMYKRISSSMR